jgi:hypothetical protein
VAAVVDQLVRLRLPGIKRHVYVLRHLGEPVAGYKGSDRLMFSGAALTGACSPRELLGVRSGQVDDRQLPRMLLLDLRQARRWLARPPSRWSRGARGTLREADDLFYDAAASLDDNEAAEATSDPAAFHRTYEYLWGNAPDLLPTHLRLRVWDDRVDWFIGRLEILNAHSRKHVRR